MKQLFICLTTVSLITACATAPRAEFDSTKPVQEIRLTKHESIYAQRNVVLTPSSLDQKLSAMNDDYGRKISKANLYQSFEFAAFLAELGSLVACLSSTTPANTLGWCGGTVALGVTTLILNQNASDVRNDVVRTYNKKYAPDIQ